MKIDYAANPVMMQELPVEAAEGVVCLELSVCLWFLSGELLAGVGALVRDLLYKLNYTAFYKEEVVSECVVGKLALYSSGSNSHPCSKPDYIVVSSTACLEYASLNEYADAVILDATCTLKALNSICLSGGSAAFIVGFLLSNLTVPLEAVVSILDNAESAKEIVRAYALSARIPAGNPLKHQPSSQQPVFQHSNS